MEQRPKLGLALGGGVARGWAHIGVLRVLERAGITPDTICGTSIGAVIGGCALAGELDALEDWARALNKLRMMSLLDFKMGQPGLIGGERLVKTLTQHLGDRTIESLPKPFLAVATDLLSGHEVWLRQGSLVEAIRASFSLPGVFPPVLVDGRWLIDGALVNPVPVSASLAQGAQVVVAVNLNADLLGKVRGPGRASAGLDLLEMAREAEVAGRGRQTGHSRRQTGRVVNVNSLVRRVFQRDRDNPSMFGVMMSSLGIVLDRISRSRLAGDPPDVHIAPKLGHIGFVEFDRAEELIQLGAAAAEAALPEIREALTMAGHPLVSSPVAAPADARTESAPVSHRRRPL